MRKCASSDSASFFVLSSVYSQYTCTDFTINTSNDVVSHTDVPFGGLENEILHFDHIFPRKRKFFANFRWDKISRKKALIIGMLVCKLPLIVIVAQ